MLLLILSFRQTGIQRVSAGIKPADVGPAEEGIGNGRLLALAGTVEGELNSLSFLLRQVK